MKHISDQHYNLAVDVISEYISMNKQSKNLRAYNKARRACIMLKIWKRKEADDGKQR